MNKSERKAKGLRARFEEQAYALLCIEPANLTITSRTMRIGHLGAPRPEVEAEARRWLREDLALHAIKSGLAILSEPELVLDTDNTGCRTLTILAVTASWDALQVIMRPDDTPSAHADGRAPQGGERTERRGDAGNRMR